MLNIDKNKLKILLGVVMAYRKSFFIVFFSYFSLLAFELYQNGLTNNIFWYMLLLPFLMILLLVYIVRDFFNMLLNDPVNALMKLSSDIYMYPLQQGLSKQIVERLLSADEVILNGSFGKNKIEQPIPNKIKASKNKSKDIQDVKVK